MHRFLAAIAPFLLCATPSPAQQTPAGHWLTQDQDGVIAISPCDAGLCAHIAGVFLDQPHEPMPLDYRGQSQCNLPLITDARQIHANLWKGHILDPRNGNMFGVELHLDPNGNLAVRGFLGIPLLGETQIWTRYGRYLPADCRIAPNPNLADPPPSGTIANRR